MFAEDLAQIDKQLERKKKEELPVVVSCGRQLERKKKEEPPVVVSCGRQPDRWLHTGFLQYRNDPRQSSTDANASQSSSEENEFRSRIEESDSQSSHLLDWGDSQSSIEESD